MRALVETAENHLARRSLQNAGDGDVDRLRDHAFGVIYHHHGSVVEVRDALVVLLAFFEDEHSHEFTGQHDGLEGVGEFVDIQNFHSM